MYDEVKTDPAWDQCKQQFETLTQSTNIKDTFINLLCLVLSIIKGVSNTLFEVTRTVINIIFEVVKELVMSAKVILTEELQWGPVRTLYMAMTGSSSMSMLDIVCMILSLETSLVCSIANVAFHVSTSTYLQEFEQFLGSVSLSEVMESGKKSVADLISGRNQMSLESDNRSPVDVRIR